MGSAGQGRRNSTLNSAALRLARLSLALPRAIEPAVTQDALYDAALAAGLSSAESRATIASGWQAGEREGPPDGLPDFSADDRTRPDMTARDITADIMRPRLTLADRLSGLTVDKAGEVVTDPAAAARALRWAQCPSTQRILATRGGWCACSAMRCAMCIAGRPGSYGMAGAGSKMRQARYIAWPARRYELSTQRPPKARIAAHVKPWPAGRRVARAQASSRRWSSWRRASRA